MTQYTTLIHLAFGGTEKHIVIAKAVKGNVSYDDQLQKEQSVVINKPLSLWQRFKVAAVETLDFKSRLWVVNVHSSRLQDDSYIVNEDNFSEPLQWMKRQQFSDDMLDKVERMRRSQVVVFNIDEVKYRLLRVK